jgi:hypothetical protein
MMAREEEGSGKAHLHSFVNDYYCRRVAAIWDTDQQNHGSDGITSLWAGRCR